MGTCYWPQPGNFSMSPFALNQGSWVLSICTTFAEEIHVIFKASHLKKEGKAPLYCQASDLITFLHLWRKHKTFEVSNLMKVTIKQWRLPIWAFKRANKKEHFWDKERWATVAKIVVPPPPVIIQALQECLTYQWIQSLLGNSNPTSGNESPANLLTSINKQPAPLLPPKIKESSSCSQEPIILNLKTQVLPHRAPSFDALVDHWLNFIKKCQIVCPLSSHGGLCKMFLETVRCNKQWGFWPQPPCTMTSTGVYDYGAPCFHPTVEFWLNGMGVRPCVPLDGTWAVPISSELGSSSPT